MTFTHGDGTTSAGRIDCYRRGHFVLEAKKLRTAGTAFDVAMLRARSQAESYARALPVEDGRPPFLIVVDVGNVIELYAEFTRSGATYTPFPDPRHHRIPLTSLADEKVRAMLAQIWIDPEELNPTRASARVTRQVSDYLAKLARSLEEDGNRSGDVAAFLTRCLFSMFAEDIGLLPKSSFLALLEKYRGNPKKLPPMLRSLWRDMDRGGFSATLEEAVLRFNGKIFKGAEGDGYVLDLDGPQIDLLISAARCNWREVEPAIFGTLLERALDPVERHSLGAHFTPRAYVERLVLPTVIEPLRAEWADAQAAALVLAQEGKLAEAREQVKGFHHRLCTVRVLDPACGSGNFLYVAMEHLKRLEGEVIDQLQVLSKDTDAGRQSALDLAGETVTLQQLLGIEINERAAAMAELVLWIGWLQWQVRSRGNRGISEPVVHDYRNIANRDALLDCDRIDLATDADGVTIMRWDATTTKTHPVTGEAVPDPEALVPEWRYINPRSAEWPSADFCVMNPPYVGNKRLRESLGNGYVDALWSAWPEVPESADLVMLFWARAAQLVAQGKVKRAGFITTNSLSMIFNRRVVQAALDNGVYMPFAIPDHPWVDSSDGAAVRVAMTVIAAGREPGLLQIVVGETTGDHGEVNVRLMSRTGMISADLRTGADVTRAARLQANSLVANRGVIPHGAGFIVTAGDAAALGLGTVPGLEQRIRPYRNNKDLTDHPRGVFALDMHGLSSGQVRERFPAVYQWLLERVKPERDHNPRPRRREMWWLFAEDQPRMRAAIAGLPRYIATGQVSKHRVFQFLAGDVLPDDKLIAVGLDDGFSLGILSSQVHTIWSLATGGTLEDRPVYSKSTCFDTFPWPGADNGLSGELRAHIGRLADKIDAHRKAAQAAGVTVTAMYNVMEALRTERELTAKERIAHRDGLVSILRDLHRELDAAVLAAYGWSDLAPGLEAGPVTCQVQGEPAPEFMAAQEELLARVLALNARRAADEAKGKVRWLRQAFQLAAQQPEVVDEHPASQDILDLEVVVPKPVEGGVTSWPSALPEQVRAVAMVLQQAQGPVGEEDIAARFKGRGPWKRSVPKILDTLEALGRARRDGTQWRAGH